MGSPSKVWISSENEDCQSSFEDNPEKSQELSCQEKECEASNDLHKFDSHSMKKIEEDLLRFFIDLDIFRHWRGILYIYRSDWGSWERIPKADCALELRKYISKDCSERINSRKMRQVIDTLLEIPELEVDFSSQDENYLNVKNGVVNLNTLEVKPHQRSMHFTYCLNFNFKKEAVLSKAPNFVQYLKTSLEYDDLPQKTQCLLEVLGYSISSVKGARKAIFLIGKSGAGKSAILELLEHVAGEKNVSNLKIHEISEKFKTAKLANVRLNISFEIKGTKLKNLETWKSVVSGERITAENKGGHPFEFKPNVKMVFAGNSLPEIEEPDPEKAILSRMKIILFNFAIPREEWDLQLFEKLCQEKDVIFSLAIAKMPGLISNKFHFTQTADELEFMTSYWLDQDSALDFLNSRCCFEENARVHVRPLYDLYVNYCKDNAVKAVSETDFKRAVRSKSGVFPKKVRINGSAPKAGFIGIRLKNDVNF